MESQNLNLVIAFSAGILSFFSPCVLPLIPSYLSFISGVSYADLKAEKQSRWNIFINTVFFIIGFSVIFIALGVIFSSIGMLTGKVSKYVNMVAGSVVILLGLNFIFDFIKFFNIEKRFHISNKPTNIFGAVLFGMAFGAGWSPCIGSILASILFLASSSGKILSGIILLTVYSLGLGTPFIVSGLFFSFFQDKIKKIMPYLNVIKIVGGIFLIIIGVFIFSGSLLKFNAIIFSFANNLSDFSIQNPNLSKIISGIIFTVFTLLLSISYIFSANKKIKQNGVTFKSFFMPVRLILIIFFLVLAILSFAGIFDFISLLVKWLSFQGV
ncbi:MAG: hypothetical protein A2086_04930 [Spirochaetes bacterium GWD1_27_9]|nr:MAG: hypothetical protein A2Z98_06935 [Spirochaetes bacterium GWB1_27_13]OHD21482.1 MAG: hypothetical protein A2Y34_01365 [Spirochaetes bacterium GWC1_27_15]OHD42452.1 MAG: hypothetical protein A2086_04930 [Spirochaetes bacterium GWD1_27_9]